MNKLPVGIQVYGVRDLLESSPENFANVMREIKQIGYDGVELAGLYGLDPQYVHDTLMEIGLIPISAHVPLSEMMEDIDKVARDYSSIGCSYVVIPYLPEKYRPNTPGYYNVLEEMKKAGNKLKQYEIRLLYHNHDFEFVKIADGTFAFDDIYKQVPEDLLGVEPDTCWIKVAGQSPEQYILKYGKRCEIVHLKDFIKEGNPKNLYKLIGTNVKEENDEKGFFEYRPVGFGQQIWEPVLTASLVAESKWVVVEQDEHYNIDSIEAARRSREYLRILGW